MTIHITYATARDMHAYESTDMLPPYKSIKVATGAAARAWLDLAESQLGKLASVTIEFPDERMPA